jgi:glycosyltransferase involved in cell wall biosynthesis
MPEAEPLVSIVTPFFNTDEFLEECIESVLAQTYQNWEYILVNNCSTDRSAEIAQCYLGKDPRIRLIHNENFLTQVQNYNHALRQISSESKYCKVVQADDWVFPECISRMVEIAEAHPSIGIVSSFSATKNRVLNCGLPYERNCFNGHDVCKKALLEGQHYFGSPTSVLLRSEIIRQRSQFYAENHPYEDTDSCYDILREWDFGFSYQVLSYIREQSGSIVSKARTFDPYYLDYFIAVSKYGSIYLESNELKIAYSKYRNRYYAFLAESFFSLKGKDFWEYHKNSLASIGLAISRPIFLKNIMLELLDISLNFKKTAGRLYNKAKRSF